MRTYYCEGRGLSTYTHVAVVEVYFDSCRDGRSQLDGWLGTHGLDNALKGDDQKGNQLSLKPRKCIGGNEQSIHH